jgi:hypothetical protein
LSATMVWTCKDCQVPRHSHACFAYFSLVSACSFLSLWPDKCSCTDKGRNWVKGPKHVCKIFPPHWMWTLRRNIYALMASALCTCNYALEKGTHFFVFWILVPSGCTILSCASWPCCNAAAFLTCWCVWCVSGVPAPASTGSECRTHL